MDINQIVPVILSAQYDGMFVSFFSRWQRNIIQTQTKMTHRRRRNLPSWLKPMRYHFKAWLQHLVLECLGHERAVGRNIFTSSVPGLVLGAQWRDEEEAVWCVRLSWVRGRQSWSGSASVLEQRDHREPWGTLPQDLWGIFWSSRLQGLQWHLWSATGGQWA